MVEYLLQLKEKLKETDSRLGSLSDTLKNKLSPSSNNYLESLKSTLSYFPPSLAETTKTTTPSYIKQDSKIKTSDKLEIKQ